MICPRQRLFIIVKVRAETAESLYTVLQTNEFVFEVEGAETILLETDWYEHLLYSEMLDLIKETRSMADNLHAKEAADQVVGLLVS